MRCQQGNESDESLSYLEEQTANATNATNATNQMDVAIEEAEVAAEVGALEEEFFQDED